MAEATADLLDTSELCAESAPDGSLWGALQRLDRMLERAIAVAQAAYGVEAANPYRGLSISPGDVERLLGQQPGIPLLHGGQDGSDVCLVDVEEGHSTLAWLARAFGLSPFDASVVVIALAPELDLRYERLYAYLQDDITRKRPTVDLVLNLLCPSAEAKLLRRNHFLADAPLIRSALIHLIPDPNQVQPPLLAHYLKLDEQIVRVLLGHHGLDSRLVSCCKLVEPLTELENLPLKEEVKRALPVLVERARDTNRPLRVYFQGPQGTGKRRTAEALAGMAGIRLLSVDLARALAAEIGFNRVLTLAFREAWFQDAMLYLDPLDVLCGEERGSSLQPLLAAVSEAPGITILAGKQPWNPNRRPADVDPLGVISVPFAMTGHGQRRACWQLHLAGAGFALEQGDLEALAGRFRLNPDQIAEAVSTARQRATWRVAAEPGNEECPSLDPSPTLADLFEAARSQCGHDLAALTQKITPVYTWDDLVLPDEVVAQLREICQRVAHRQRVHDDWGFARKLSLGKGVNVLFAGPSGTGKTMAAEIIAGELGLDLYRIDLSQVVSKYIGETEKNLNRVFSTAENANAILFFDEADALFGKRSEVRDAHDRYANIEISYLLQKMEEYDGVAILASNLSQNLDDAFVRRLAFTIHFPFPDEAQRRRIWAGIWPVEAPLSEDLRLDVLAGQFRLSGGNIRNVALAASFLAAADGGRVALDHVLQATRREYQKLGRVLSEAELQWMRGD